MVVCAVLGCKNSPARKNNEKKIRFHYFPKDAKLCEMWIKACGNKNEYSLKNSRVCSEHFVESDYRLEDILLNISEDKRLLKMGSVPSKKLPINECEESSKKRIQEVRDNKKIVDECLAAYENSQKPSASNSVPRESKQEDEFFLYDQENYCVYSNSSTQTEVEYNCSKELRIMQLEKELNIFKKIVKRKNQQAQKDESMRSSIRDLFTPSQTKLLENPNKKPRWSADDISSALSLYSAGPKSYRLLRKRKFPFPSLPTLRRWTKQKEIKPVKKRQTKLSRLELEALDKTELIDKIIQLQAHNIQLKNILQKKLDAESVGGSKSERESADIKSKRKFDFSKSSKRHVLLKFLYFGWDYNGLVCQEDSNKTIEYHIFKSLIRTCLIESRETSNYNRCGRTDKEVSAFCQVISIDLRSKFPEEQHFTDEAIKNEIDYCDLLNKVLPKNIQCIAWMPLRCKEYSARFDCQKRTYRYFFPIGDLNLATMRTGCELLTKSKDADFRNLCKMDVHNGVMNYKRKIYSVTINECPNQNEKDGFKMYYLEIQANSFLWHQIRCIMSVLLLIGEGKEEPKVIEDLLDVGANPCKPQYTPAAAFPLNLYNCEFRKISGKNKMITQNDQSLIDVDIEAVANCDLTNWVHNKENLSKLIETIQGGWTEQSIKSFMMRSVLGSLEDLIKKEFGDYKSKAQANVLHECVKRKQYQQLMTRKRCESLENRVEHFVKKQRLVVKDS